VIITGGENVSSLEVEDCLSPLADCFRYRNQIGVIRALDV
jgi:hypothetical protein